MVRSVQDRFEVKLSRIRFFLIYCSLAFGCDCEMQRIGQYSGAAAGPYTEGFVAIVPASQSGSHSFRTAVIACC